MPVQRTAIQEVEIARIEQNPFSANLEDGATFSRLREELKAHGMLELPVLLKSGDGWRVLAGAHRVAGWSQLGNTTVEAIVVEGKLAPEEEFNLVNNLNTIRGDLSVSRVKRIVRQQGLDVSKLDVFKYPISRLTAGPPTSMTDGTAQRRARIRDMSLRIASKVAEVLLDDMDAAVVCFRVEDVPVAVVRLALTKQSARKNISTLKAKARDAFKEWLAG